MATPYTTPAPPSLPVPFDNHSFTVGELTVESAADLVSLHGSLDIRADRGSLAAARQLAAYLSRLIGVLEAQDRAAPLPGHASLDSPTWRPNPLA